MSEVLNVIGNVAVSAAKSVAAQKGNEVLVEGIKSALKQTGYVDQEMLDNPAVDTLLKIAAPALILYISTANKPFLAEHLGAENANRVQELATMALQGASTEAIKPLINFAIPALKNFLSAGVSLKELTGEKPEEFTVVQKDK